MKERDELTIPAAGVALPPLPEYRSDLPPVGGANDLTLHGVGPPPPNHDQARTIIEPLAWPGSATTVADSSSSASFLNSSRLVIPGYRILRQIGQGGMGIVYEAEQDHPRRRVALKLIRGGPFAGEQRVKLFEREVQALARLRHPSIAGIYHAGHTAGGEPFFTMELARGATLDEAVRAGRAPEAALAKLEARLRLFVSLCEAVNYAHQRGVVHRDLKPANILVGAAPVRSSEAALPELKILDFGLARITDPDFVSSVVTQGAVVRGTLAYMSPEQARGRSDDIDLRTDVYSLGVVLYELVAGALPYTLADATQQDALRIICEELPRPLCGPHARPGPAVAEDLETIILKALEKEPARRYQSALALAEDLQRQLADQPILARSPSAVYQFRKLVRRHRATSTLMAALFLTILASAVFMGVQRNRARVAAEQARAEGAQAVAVKDFLKGILTTGNHAQTGRDARVLDVLQDAAGHLSARMPDQPAVEATLHDTLSESFYYLGQYDQARRQAEAAVAIHTRLFSKDHLTTLKSMDNLVAALMGQGHFPEAETLARDVIQRKQALVSPVHRETLASMYHLSSILLYRGKLAAAETVAREISDTGQRVLPPGDEVTLNGMNDLGVVLRKQKRLEEGEALLRRALELSLRARSEEHPVTLELMTNLVGSLHANGKLAEAEQLSRRTLAVKQRVLGPAHAETIVTQSGLARMLCKQKRPEGEVLLRELVTLVSAPGFESLNPPEMYTGRLGKCVADFGRWAEAETLLLASYEGLQSKLGADDNRTKDVRDALVALYAAWGKPKHVALWREKPGLGT